MLDPKYYSLVGCVITLAMLLSFGACLWQAVRAFIARYGEHPE